MGRPQQHLAEVVRNTGSGNATDELRSILRNGLVALNDAQQAERLAQRGTADKLNPHVSDAGKCPRQITYSLRNIKPSDPMTEDSLTNFLVGHAVEEVWAKILIAAGAEIVREERVSIPAGNTVVTGRKDFGIKLLWRQSIVELKSTNSRSMAFMLKSGEKGKADHRKQLNLYLHASKFPHPLGAVDTGYLVYVVKDATKGEPILHAWEVEYDEGQANNDLMALSLADEIAKRGELAPVPEGYSSTKFPCTYCNWRSACWKGGK
jgi:CRISPR/Cas system-associated exonuclease Cas4 (RecB family)